MDSMEVLDPSPNLGRMDLCSARAGLWHPPNCACQSAAERSIIKQHLPQVNPGFPQHYDAETTLPKCFSKAKPSLDVFYIICER